MNTKGIIAMSLHWGQNIEPLTAHLRRQLHGVKFLHVVAIDKTSRVVCRFMTS